MAVFLLAADEIEPWMFYAMTGIAFFSLFFAGWETDRRKKLKKENKKLTEKLSELGYKPPRSGVELLDVESGGVKYVPGPDEDFGNHVSETEKFDWDEWVYCKKAPDDGSLDDFIQSAAASAPEVKPSKITEEDQRRAC